MKTNMNRPIPLHNDEEEFFIHKEGVAVIELKHIGKVYHAKGGDLEALKDINLSIEEGEIYGIIGLSVKVPWYAASICWSSQRVAK